MKATKKLKYSRNFFPKGNPNQKRNRNSRRARAKRKPKPKTEFDKAYEKVSRDLKPLRNPVNFKVFNLFPGKRDMFPGRYGGSREL